MAWDYRFGTSAYVPMGPFVNSSNGVALTTALTGQTIYLAKNLGTTGSTYAARASTVAILESSAVLGNIFVPLTSADVDTYGPMRLITTSSGTFLPVWTDINVISQEAWDVKYSTTRITVGAFSTGIFTTATPTTAVYNAISSQVGVQSSFSTGNFTTGWRDAVQSLIAGAITTATPTTQVFDLIVTAMNAGTTYSTGNITTGWLDRTLVAGRLTSDIPTTGTYAAFANTWTKDGLTLAQGLGILLAAHAGLTSGFDSTSATIYAVDQSTVARLSAIGTSTDGNRLNLTVNA